MLIRRSFSQLKKLHICVIVHDHNNCVSKNINQSTIDMLIAAPLRISENNNDDEWQYMSEIKMSSVYEESSALRAVKKL